MDAKRNTPFAAQDRPAVRPLPPFGGLGFNLCGLGQACARLPLHRPEPREAQKPAPSARV
jgi:hypothetical protein